MKRKLNTFEDMVIRKVAERLPEQEQGQLLKDLSSAFVVEESLDGSRITFGLDGYDRPAYRGQHSFGVEAELQDKDGASVSVDLFGDENGRLLELELIRWGHGDLIEPDWHTLAFP